MSREFTNGEVKEVVGAARVYCPGLSETQFQSLVDMQRHFADSGYLEAVDGLARLVKDGVPCTKALDEYRVLLRRLSDLEKKASEAQAKLEALEKERQQAEETCRQTKDSLQQARKEKEQVTAIRVKEERELEGFRVAVTTEKERLDKELARCQQKANVSKEDITAAGKLKTEVETLGFTMELMLDLTDELANSEDARDELATGLQKCGTFKGYIATFDQQYQEKKKALETELNIAQAEKGKRQAEADCLEATRHNLEGVLSQLKSDVAYEDDLRRFHRRYWGVSGLMEYLATWEQVFFLRCNSPISTMTSFFNAPAGLVRFWTDKPAVTCPHCGMKMILFDEKPYAALGWPVGAPGRLTLGE